MPTASISRRRLLQSSAIAAGALAFPTFVPRSAFGANEKLNIAAIGIGGKGEVDVSGCDSENIVALCDVDLERGSAMFKKFPKAKRYRDYRQMLQQEQKNIDAVIVSAPDHIHAPAAMMAMRMGKHIYCQKPLTHTVQEARLMTQLARDKKLATQMGNQGHSHPDTRRLVELIKGGVLGKVGEVRVWSDRPIWPQGIQRPKGTESVPPTLDWDLWLGPAPQRPYNKAYVPFNWRGFWDFGTGALGDMACHCMDLAFFALDLPAPTSISAEASGHNEESAPNSSVIEYHFPAAGNHPPIRMTWYDGGKLPPADLVKGKKLSSNGIIVIGDKDTLYVPNYWGAGMFLSGAKTEDFKNVTESLPRLPDFDRNHYVEWINACKGGPKAMSNFDYSGPMTEAVLLGNVAIRAGGKLDWDAKAMRVTNVSDANRYLTKDYRKGWGLNDVTA